MFKNEGGGVKGRLNNVKKKTDDLVREGVPKSAGLTRDYDSIRSG